MAEVLPEDKARTAAAKRVAWVFMVSMWWRCGWACRLGRVLNLRWRRAANRAGHLRQAEEPAKVILSEDDLGWLREAHDGTATRISSILIRG